MRLTVDRLRQHGAQRPGGQRVALGRIYGRLRAGQFPARSRLRDCRIRSSARRAKPRQPGGPLAEGSASGGGLQPRSLRGPGPSRLHAGWVCESGASVDRVRGHSRLYAATEAAARIFAPWQGSRRGQFPELPCRDGSGPTHRQARPRRRGASRPQHHRTEPSKSGFSPHDRTRAERSSRCGPAGGIRGGRPAGPACEAG